LSLALSAIRPGRVALWTMPNHRHDREQGTAHASSAARLVGRPCFARSLRRRCRRRRCTCWWRGVRGRDEGLAVGRPRPPVLDRASGPVGRGAHRRLTASARVILPGDAECTAARQLGHVDPADLGVARVHACWERQRAFRGGHIAARLRPAPDLVALRVTANGSRLVGELMSLPPRVAGPCGDGQRPPRSCDVPGESVATRGLAQRFGSQILISADQLPHRVGIRLGDYLELSDRLAGILVGGSTRHDTASREHPHGRSVASSCAHRAHCVDRPTTGRGSAHRTWQPRAPTGGSLE
jgi:hypothetical protein